MKNREIEYDEDLEELLVEEYTEENENEEKANKEVKTAISLDFSKLNEMLFCFNKLQHSCANISFSQVVNTLNFIY